MSSSLECWDDEETVDSKRVALGTLNRKRIALGTPQWAVPAVLLGIISVMTMAAFLLEPPGYQIQVAFVGNSMQYVNVGSVRYLAIECVMPCFYKTHLHIIARL